LPAANTLFYFSNLILPPNERTLTIVVHLSVQVAVAEGRPVGGTGDGGRRRRRRRHFLVAEEAVMQPEGCGDGGARTRNLCHGGGVEHEDVAALVPRVQESGEQDAVVLEDSAGRRHEHSLAGGNSTIRQTISDTNITNDNHCTVTAYKATPWPSD
jgi:hypothetical protein